MEVHHHSQHGKKKWTGYFWEFLMLFLAVFCGFLAEYQLEHKIEKDREKQYMVTMIEDMRTDSAMLETNIRERSSRIQMIDSLVALLNSGDLNGKGDDIYFFGRSISPPTNIFPNDRTIQQLKSSGNLRLIRNKDISNEIMAYDQMIRQTLFELDDEIVIRGEYRQLAGKVFNTTVFHEMISTDTVAKPTGSPKLYTTNPDLINELIGSIQYFKRVHQAQLIRSEKLLKKAKQLSDFIKNEYHFK
jgi:hypothetical protein